MEKAPVFLVAVDFSACSRRALEAAAAMAKEGHVRLVVVHALAEGAEGLGVREGGPLDPINQVLAEEQRDDALRLSADIVEPLRARGIDVTLLAREGRARSIVPQAIDDVAPAMVFIGHHSGGLRLGSVAKAVLDAAKCPVVVVPHEE